MSVCRKTAKAHSNIAPHQEIKDRVGWVNNILAQLDPPQEPTQPPPNLEIIPQDENKQENRAAQQTPEDEETKKSGKPH